ncbi:chromate transporter [Bariatricus sp. SGI.154]|uniref:chromate transporter n=1 Tax=Bariatricus sp. SGI.154 TaxID=3420549 RepID=UPI003CFBCFEE
MVYLELFWSFMKIGFTSFGGMSMIPLILEEMQSHQWMTAEDLANLVAIAEMTPGPLGVNCATFAGTQTAGVLGGIVAVLGVLMPAFTLTLLVAIFYTRFRKSEVMAEIMSWVRPICIAMILAVILTLGKENYFTDGKSDWIAVGIGVAMLYLIMKRKWTVPKVIGSSAVLGIVLYTLSGLV